jgi:hypothetical protein
MVFDSKLDLDDHRLHSMTKGCQEGERTRLETIRTNPALAEEYKKLESLAEGEIFKLSDDRVFKRVSGFIKLVGTYDKSTGGINYV